MNVTDMDFEQSHARKSQKNRVACDSLNTQKEIKCDISLRKELKQHFRLLLIFDAFTNACKSSY